MRRLSLFALIFIILVSLYWLLEGRGGKNTVREPDHLLTGFKPANVDRINITCSDSDPIVLQRTDGGWQVATDRGASYPADSSAVQTLFESLTELKTNSMVSHKSARHELYEVSPETGLYVEALDREKRTLAEVLIGKSGPNIFSTYVRTTDSDAVYLVDGILQNTASKTLNEWRDKSVFSLDPEDVHAYTVHGDCSLALRKNDTMWLTGPENTPVDTGAVTKLMHRFAGLSAVDFAKGTLEEFALNEPSRTVTAKLGNGTQATLLLGADANAFQQYAKQADADTIYIIEKHLVNMLCPTIEELNSPAPEENAPSATNR
jgi:hypothetical protein